MQFEFSVETEGRRSSRTVCKKNTLLRRSIYPYTYLTAFIPLISNYFVMDDVLFLYSPYIFIVTCPDNWVDQGHIPHIVQCGLAYKSKFEF